MRNRFDQLAKAILGVVLKPITPVETGHEIPGQVLIADLWVEPAEEQAHELERLGTLGRMLELGPCLLEPFSRVPKVKDIRSCILKQYTLGHHRGREAARAGRPEPAWPLVWVISSGQPETLIDSMALCEMEEWPDGFWQAREFDGFYVVVARLLPDIPETLLLRLLGRGVTFREAVRELVAEPEHVWARRLLEPVLVAFRREIPHDCIEAEDMEALRELEAVYTEWEQRVKDEARRDGERAGHRAGLLALIECIEMLCASYDIELSADKRKCLASYDIPELKEVMAALITARRWPA